MHKAVTGLREKIHGFQKLCSGPSYSVADPELNVNELTVYITINFFKKKHALTQLHIDQLTKML